MHFKSDKVTILVRQKDGAFKFINNNWIFPKILDFSMLKTKKAEEKEKV
jgi:hypothetical protein